MPVTGIWKTKWQQCCDWNEILNRFCHLFSLLTLLSWNNRCLSCSLSYNSSPWRISKHWDLLWQQWIRIRTCLLASFPKSKPYQMVALVILHCSECSNWEQNYSWSQSSNNISLIFIAVVSLAGGLVHTRNSLWQIPTKLLFVHLPG